MNGKSVDPGLTRRELLARSGATLAGVAAAGLGSAALADDTKPGGTRIGRGAYTYEVVDGWGSEPAANRFHMGCGVVVDSKDRVYVHSNASQCTFVYDRSGKVVNDWGTEWAAKGHGLYWNKEGRDEL